MTLDINELERLHAISSSRNNEDADMAFLDYCHDHLPAILSRLKAAEEMERRARLGNADDPCYSVGVRNGLATRSDP